MSQRRAIVAVFSLLAGDAVLGGSADAASTPGAERGARGHMLRQVESVRRVARERGRRLETLLRPTDDVLEVIDEQPYGTPPPPPPPGYPGHGKPELQRQVEGAPLVALVHVERLEGAPTEGGDWVRTTAHCTISHLYKAIQELRAGEGGIRLTTLGGEVHIGRQRIRARHHSASALAIGADYLVFAVPIDTGAQGALGVVETGVWYRVEGNELVSVATGVRREAAPMLADIANYVTAERP
jgi:hypothetical protein